MKLAVVQAVGIVLGLSLAASAQENRSEISFEGAIYKELALRAEDRGLVYSTPDFGFGGYWPRIRSLTPLCRVWVSASGSSISSAYDAIMAVTKSASAIVHAAR